MLGIIFGTEAKETYEELSKDDLADIIQYLLEGEDWHDIQCNTGLGKSTCEEIERVYWIIHESLS